MATTLATPPASALSTHASANNIQSEPIVTILLTSFAGLGLPRTLSLPVKASTSVHDALQAIFARLPKIDHPLFVTTTSNKQLIASNHEPISTLLVFPGDTIIPLRLSARLCGGKGGFGSQLRAAGGRMSSRKNRNQNQNPNGSNRNLDGRRLRTVDTAKRLAEYLANKDEVEKTENDEKRKRLEDVIANAERTEEAIKSGKMGSGQGRLDAEYVESKELAEEKTREAVVRAMREAMVGVERTGSESSMEVDEDASEDGVEEGSSGSSEDAEEEKAKQGGLSFFGFDEDEDDDSDEVEEEDEGETAPQQAYEGKGKGKAT